jgi:redox-sensing transcriptional repressor
MADNKNIISTSVATIQRMPSYLSYLKNKLEEGDEYVSSVVMAAELGLTPMVVKKDLSLARVVEGIPKRGFHISKLIDDIKTYLGYDNVKDAVLVGVGQLGKVLMSYSGFANYGLNILAGFDVNKTLINKEVNGKKVFHIDKLEDLVRRMNIHIGIITTPKEVAQEVADLMIKAGVKAIWNFSPTHLIIPDNVVLKNEDMAASLAILSNKLKELL